MAFGLPLVLATLLSATSPPAVFSSGLPICDELGLSDQEARAEIVAMLDMLGSPPVASAPSLAPERPSSAVELPAATGGPMTLAGFARACFAPQTAEAQQVCTGVRANIWVNQMSSGCSSAAHPRPAVPPALRASRPSPPRDGLACVGPECFQDPVPLSAGSRSNEGRSPFVVSALHLATYLATSPVFEPARPDPEAPPLRRLLRPPIA